jgi:hypothetical protein
MVKFPGAYKKTDPSFNFSIYGGIKPYPMPGPAVWVGGNSASSGNSTAPSPVSEQPTQQPTQKPTQKPTPVQSVTTKPTTTKAATTKAASTPTVSPGAGGEGPKGCGRRHARSFR